MRKTAIAMMTALIMLLATVATASPGTQSLRARGKVSVEPVNMIFDQTGASTSQRVGVSVLRRTENRLSAFATARGLEPGGVYTFWWVVLPEGAGHDLSQAYVALGGSKVVGRSGRAFMWMGTATGANSIPGFLLPFRDLDFDLDTADVHIEIAYHGQRNDPAYDSQWRMDFWTGTACPSALGINVDYDGVHGTNPDTTAFPEPPFSDQDFNVNGQPHCPVSYASTHGH